MLFFFEARLTKPRMLKEAHIAATGRSILAFLREMRGMAGIWIAENAQAIRSEGS